jgi:pyruvate dehydrogenase E1 component
MNENYVHPAMPPGAQEGILRGMHPLQLPANAKVQLLGSGTILREAIAAADMLAKDWGIDAGVWSITSFSELAREGAELERAHRLAPLSPRKVGWVEQQLAGTKGPVIAASDYVRAVPDLIRAFVPRKYVTLGTDGFGRSDTRAALRDFFEVSREHIVVTALSALADEGSAKAEVVAEAIGRYRIDPTRPPSWTR